MNASPPSRPAQIAERLKQLRHSMVGWLDLQALAELQDLLRQSPSSSEAVEIEAYTLLLDLNTEAPKALRALQRCQELLNLAQALQHPLCEAAVWRVMQLLQSFLMLHPAALHSAGMAAKLYADAGEHELEQMMLESHNYVLFHAQMYEELYASCQSQLPRARQSRNVFCCRLIWGAASAAYTLGMRCPQLQQREEWWRQARELHLEALALSQTLQQTMMEAISLLNLAVVEASLGQVPAARAYLDRIGALTHLDAHRPGWEAWFGLAQALIELHEPRNNAAQEEAAWGGLLATARRLLDGGLNHAAAAEAALRTINHLGRQRNRLDDALWAMETLLDQQLQARQALAQNMSDTLSVALELPRLRQEKDRLMEQGFALEQSLAQRNQELSHALAKVQAEASIRAAAEAALQKAHDELEAQVRARSAELELALRTLMRQEKQLALSRMVVGVAHEMNTPLGNARMAASTMQDQCQDLRAQTQLGQLRRSELDQALNRLQEGSELVDRNLARAGQLVERFKALAISQHQEAPQQLDLAAQLRQWAQAWQARLPGPDFRLDISGLPERLAWQGFPRALHEVLDQLFDNSLQHGWAGRTQGWAGLALSQIRTPGDETEEREAVQLLWQDDGPGIPAEHLPHVLEPFFCTRLGQGGSGLGLSTAHSLVCELMGGRLELQSPPGQGCQVRITLPRLPAAAPVPAWPDHSAQPD
ncbi:sensor histidine kinase [Kinneretia aquatilis]|nr:HAMP domain-containing sensor histidine kinase [Paucibacter aquatile]